VAAREEDVFQILLQLLINAIQASEKQSVVEIEVRWADEAAELRVLDRGPGIRPNLLPHVFDPFFTTKTGESNVGLGLSLAYDLARQNGGSLEVENREGGGACFTLRLPIALHEPDEDPQDPESQGGQVGSGASRRPGREG
jgi:signal transduction histidine kinase